MLNLTNGLKMLETYWEKDRLKKKQSKFHFISKTKATTTAAAATAAKFSTFDSFLYTVHSSFIFGFSCKHLWVCVHMDVSRKKIYSHFCKMFTFYMATHYSFISLWNFNGDFVRVSFALAWHWRYRWCFNSIAARKCFIFVGHNRASVREWASKRMAYSVLYSCCRMLWTRCDDGKVK